MTTTFERIGDWNGWVTPIVVKHNGAIVGYIGDEALQAAHYGFQRPPNDKPYKYIATCEDEETIGIIGEFALEEEARKFATERLASK